MTKAQIKSKINQLNKELSSYKNQRQQYQTLKDKVTQIVGLLNNSIDSLNSAKNYLKNGYGGNVKTTPFKNTNNDIQKITEIKKYLELRVILEINSQIRNLNNNCTKTQNTINKLWKEYYAVEN